MLLDTQDLNPSLRASNFHRSCGRFRRQGLPNKRKLNLNYTPRNQTSRANPKELSNDVHSELEPLVAVDLLKWLPQGDYIAYRTLRVSMEHLRCHLIRHCQSLTSVYLFKKIPGSISELQPVAIISNTHFALPLRTTLSTIIISESRRIPRAAI